MEDLVVVGRGPDGALLLAPAPGRRPTHRLPDADAVRTALEQPVGRRAAVVRHPRVVLTPAQLQARLRAGASVDELARETGLPTADVERWAGPVEAERTRVLTSAMGTHVSGDAEQSPRPLGELLVTRDGDDVTWSATRRRDGRWRVLLRVARDGQVLTASWVHDLRTGELVAASARARALSFPGR